MTAGRRRRLDIDLVRRGLSPNREQARAAITSGRVTVAGAAADRPARLVAPTEPVEVAGPPPRFVSRGGEKLDAALERFAVSVEDAVALDAGASTGGFTDCLLQRGAARVAAVDVGHGQLHPGLRADVRVLVLERTNVRHLRPDDLAGLAPVDLVTADLSFISLTTVAPVLTGPVLRRGGDLVLLVKPQFEAGRAAASRGKGVIRDPDEWLGALRAVASRLAECGAAIMDAMRSPLTGASGNVEYLVHARTGDALAVPDADEILRSAIGQPADGGG